MRLLRKLARYATVSAISTSISMTILGVLVATSATTAGWANVIATSVGMVPSFELNRRWVWGKAGSRSLGAEIGPFCLLSFAALGLSTMAVSAAAGWAATSGLGPTARTIAAETASVATFGTLWILQYLLLDGLLFRAARPAAEPTAQSSVDTGHPVSRPGDRVRSSASTGRRSQGSTTKARTQCVEEDDAASGGPCRRDMCRISWTGH